QGNYPTANIELIYEAESNSQHTVSLDETLVTRILSNLLSNAVKYSKGSQSIQLKIKIQNSWAVLSVADQGIGINPDDLSRIFMPFYRSHDTLYTDGTGLGLSIVRDCVERHHGTIQVNSKVGIGTTFIVKLPTENYSKK
ncbi:MAG: ATP-binding protein, partial [Chloroflexota bacterium]